MSVDELAEPHKKSDEVRWKRCNAVTRLAHKILNVGPAGSSACTSVQAASRCGLSNRCKGVKTMDNKSEKAILRAKFENYRLLSRQFPDGMTAKNIRLLSAEVEQELRKYGEDAEPR